MLSTLITIVFINKIKIKALLNNNVKCVLIQIELTLLIKLIIHTNMCVSVKGVNK